MTSPEEPLVRLAIVNDYTVVVEGLAAIFGPARGFEVVHKGRSRSRSHQQPLRLPPVDLVLLDPFGSPESLTEKVARIRRHQQPKLVVVSWHRTAASLQDAMVNGCAGYLSKALDGEALVAAVRRIATSSPTDPPEILWPGGQTPDGDWPGRDAGLSARESEVLSLIAQGLNNHDVTALTHVGSESLRKHIRSAYRKIGAASRTEAVIWCLAHGF